MLEIKGNGKTLVRIDPRDIPVSELTPLMQSQGATHFMHESGSNCIFYYRPAPIDSNLYGQTVALLHDDRALIGNPWILCNLPQNAVKL